MKRIDKLLLSAFAGPFLMTFLVIVFILLCQHMLRYFDDIIGKGLDFDVIAQLIFFFAVVMTPVALPLSILVSSLITFGNLAEHGELSAIKSAGISLPRTMLPILFIVALLTVGAFHLNNSIVPNATLEAYSLMYDIKKKKPALNLSEGAFYNGIPGMSIKVDETFPDGKTLSGIVLYDHRKDNGNSEVIVADSGRMFTIAGEKYMKFELYRGYNYSESHVLTSETVSDKKAVASLAKSRFDRSVLLFDLASIGLVRTDKDLFHNHKMKDLSAIDSTVSAIRQEILRHHELSRDRITESLNAMSGKLSPRAITPPAYADAVDSIFRMAPARDSANAAVTRARQMKAFLQQTNNDIAMLKEGLASYKVQWHKIFASSFACIAMFLIGAPLGSIIRKGGLGVPFLVAILFFIIYYISNVQGEKLARQGLITPGVGAWAASGILLLIGVFFVSKARTDTPLFERSAYRFKFLRKKTRSRAASGLA